MPGGGAGASQMLTCQISFAVAVVTKIVWMIERYPRWRRGVMVVVLHLYRIADVQVDDNGPAEVDAGFFY